MMNDWNTCRATQCAPGQPAGLHLALQRCDGFKDQSPKACTLKPGRELPTPKAQTIFVMGVMGYQTNPATPGATFGYDPAPALIAMRVARIEAVCQRHATPLKAAALQFALAHASVSTLLLGPRSVAELDDNLAMLAFSVPDALWAELKALREAGDQSSSKNGD